MQPTDGTAVPGDDELSAALQAVAQLRHAAEALAGGPGGGQRIAESEDGRIVVTARAAKLVSVAIEAPPIGQSLDHGPFEKSLLDAVREALRPVTPAVVVSDPSIAQAAADLDRTRVAAFAERQFTGADDEQRVSATVAGTGELSGLSVSVAASRGDGLALLGGAVVEAIGRAQVAWSTARAEEFGLSGGREAMREQADALIARMDALHSEITQINGRLDSALDEARRLAGE